MLNSLLDVEVTWTFPLWIVAYVRQLTSVSEKLLAVTSNMNSSNKCLSSVIDINNLSSDFNNVKVKNYSFCLCCLHLSLEFNQRIVVQRIFLLLHQNLSFIAIVQLIIAINKGFSGFTLHQ